MAEMKGGVTHWITYEDGEEVLGDERWRVYGTADTKRGAEIDVALPNRDGLLQLREARCYNLVSFPGDEQNRWRTSVWLNGKEIAALFSHRDVWTPASVDLTGLDPVDAKSANMQVRVNRIGNPQGDFYMDTRIIGEFIEEGQNG